MDVNELDYSVNALFNQDGTAKRSFSSSAEEMSVNRPKVRNKRRTIQKTKGVKTLAEKAILFVALGSLLTVGAKSIKNTQELNAEVKRIETELGESATANKEYGGFNEQVGEYYWWYDVGGASKDILDNNKNYDIDTRIYGCYNKLGDYDKIEHMDKIFQNMSTLIANDPSKYTEDEIKACMHNSFQDYLDSKSISLSDYESLMNKVLIAYAKGNVNMDEVNELLSELNQGGAR